MTAMIKLHLINERYNLLPSSIAKPLRAYWDSLTISANQEG